MKALKKIDKVLTKIMNDLATVVGRPYVFAATILLALAWFIAGIFMEYDTWFDIMDVSVFLITFFLLFVVQSSQNADTTAIQDKLDEIIDVLPKADTTKEAEEKRMKRGDKQA
jgi:low affinity Fe/Cu permease